MKHIIAALFALLSVGAMADSPFPINYDWAKTVVEDPTGGWNHYNPGNIPYSYPGWANDVMNVYDGESIILEFDHEIKDDPMNPWGYDFIVFPSFYGKAVDIEYAYGYANTEDTEAIYDMSVGEWSNDPFEIFVEVSSDGTNWNQCSTTMTRWNTAPVMPVPITSDFQWDNTAIRSFTYPVDRYAYEDLMYSGNFTNSVKDISDCLGYSAGGCAFDLKEFGVQSAKYIRLTASAPDPDHDYVAIAGASDVSIFKDFKVLDFKVNTEYYENEIGTNEYRYAVVTAGFFVSSPLVNDHEPCSWYKRFSLWVSDDLSIDFVCIYVRDGASPYAYDTINSNLMKSGYYDVMLSSSFAIGERTINGKSENGFYFRVQYFLVGKNKERPQPTDIKHSQFYRILFHDE